MSSSSKSVENSRIYYATQAEIFMSLKDVHQAYTLSPLGELKTNSNIRNQMITVYCKPPGALQWLEKYKSEIVPGKSNLQFVATLLLNFEDKDAESIALKFEIRQLVTQSGTSSVPGRSDMCLWSTTHTTLDKIISAGCKGLDLILPLDFGNGVDEALHLTKKVKKSFPGKLFLRGEIIQPSDFAVMFQFGIKTEKPAEDYFIEMHKLNQDNSFDMSHPHTLIYRSDLEVTLPCYPTQKDPRVYFAESRLSNGDLDRVLKIDVLKKENFKRKGFAFTNLGNVFKNHAQVLNVDWVDPSYPYKKEMKVILNLCGQIPIHPIDYYFNLGWKIIPVYAVDFSRSNCNEQLHKRVLHDSQQGRNPYEEALEICSDTMKIISAGHEVLYGFGCTEKPYMNAYKTTDEQISSTVQNYYEALCMSLMSSLSVASSTLSTQERSPMDGGASASSHSSTSSSSYPLVLLGTSLLSPLFSDLVTLITARKVAYEYFTVIIFTDGQFTDSARYLGILQELSILPVSIIFIGIGLGDFRLLLELERAWLMQISEAFVPRKFVHLIHFRCKNHWESSLAYEKYRSSPYEIFAKEILTTVRDQAVEYFRRNFKEAPRPSSSST